MKLVLTYGVKEIQLIGYCFGGVLALEVANRLNEQGTVLIKSLSILDSLLLPPSFIVEDELLMEMMFLDNIHVSFDDVGMPALRVAEQIVVQEAMKKIVIKDGLLRGLSGPVEKDALGALFFKIGKMGKEERFRWYAKLCEKNTGTEMPMDLIQSLYGICINTFAAISHDICPYLGKLYYFYAIEGEGSFKKMVPETITRVLKIKSMQALWCTNSSH